MRVSMMQEQGPLYWGIIGCGDVTEHKSGPAFNKVPQSHLQAVMRRDKALAADYAGRHGVPLFFNNATQLIEHPQVNAIYIATPPDSHLQYCLQALAAGKPVYVEKPMAIHYKAALTIQHKVEELGAKLSVAHYRNAQPFFNAIKQRLVSGAIGRVSHVKILLCRPPLSAVQLLQPSKAWRVNPAISGGGLFHDLAPHQLGLLLHFFGMPLWVKGNALCTQSLYQAQDRVDACIGFEKGIVVEGCWNFNDTHSQDECVITGSDGQIKFSFFGSPVFYLTQGDVTQSFAIEAPIHAQQPLIEKVVQYFLGNGPNPVSAGEGCTVMQLIEMVTNGSAIRGCYI